MKNLLIKFTKFSVWMLIFAGAGFGAYSYFQYKAIYPSTDDAYVNANIVNIAAQVSGPVTKVNVQNNQFVEKDQVLFTIDSKLFMDQVKQAKAKLDLARQKMYVDSDAINIARAQLAQAKAQLLVDEKNYERIKTLVKGGQSSIASGDNAKGKLDSSKANLIAAQNQLRQAKQNLGSKGDNNAQIQQALAALNSAELNLDYANVKAPNSGYLTNFKIRTGSMINAGQPLFQLVESENWWIDANYKETQMQRIQIGQKAKIKIDLYPKKEFTGTIESISRGSGAAFSLLPPENATGNWVKVTQRFPIKVSIDNPDTNYPLRVGASSIVTIETKTPEA